MQVSFSSAALPKSGVIILPGFEGADPSAAL